MPAARSRPESAWKRTAVVSGVAITAGVVLLVAVIVPRQTNPATPPLVVAGFAEGFVHTYLSAAGEESEETLAPFLGYSPSLIGMRPGAFYVTNVSVRGFFPHEEGWTVEVRAEVLEQTERGFAPSHPRHFAIRVIDRPGAGLLADGLPAPIAAPTVAAVPAPALEAPPSDDGTAEAVAAYLDWYLTGSAPIGGSAPAGGFAGVELLTLHLEADTAVAGVAVTTGGGHTLRVEVPLARVAGVWQVVDLSRESS
ncbi:MAG: hypothetical protein P1T08_11575 [Acidimicrobiia bacterium]|nr:hypothetical protein [Acidimicrobiia bacterium]